MELSSNFLTDHVRNVRSIHAFLKSLNVHPTLQLTDVHTIKNLEYNDRV